MAQTILITGGSFGLGLEMARAFTGRGHKVYACARSADKLAAAAKEIPGLVTIRADISEDADRRRLFSEIAARGDKLDMLINNAAISMAHDYTNDFTLNADRARDEIEINFAAPIELIRLFLAERRALGRDSAPATIVNVSTPGALFPLDANPLYTATKAGFHNFTLALRRHMRGTAVKVIEVFPPALETGLTAQLDVPSEAENGGARAVAECAERTVASILRGEEVIAPHPQAEALVKQFMPDIGGMLDAINSAVSRKPGWDAAH
ncbi:MAG: SDR family NAD(P)-dependent oxidoreductase [Caulobacterales bacterium]